MNFRTCGYALLLASIVGLGLRLEPAAAQSATSQNPSGTVAATSSGSDGPGLEALSEITVTAQRRSERLRDVPISVNTATAAELEQAGVSSTQDLVAVVPGLVFDGEGAWIQPAIRGVQTTLTTPGSDNPIALYVDGVYQPAQTGLIFNLPDVSRIEVLKGPQGTLFGRNATGGAIEVFTQDPTFTTSGKFSLLAGEYFGGTATSSAAGTASGFISGPLIGDVLAGSLAASFDDTEGYIRNIATGDRAGQTRSQLYRGKLLFAPADSVKFILSAYYTDLLDYQTEAGTVLKGATAGAAYPDAIIATAPWETSYDTPRPFVHVTTRGASLRGTMDIPGGTLTTTTGYSKIGSVEDVDVDGSTSAACLAAFACIPFIVTNPEETISQEINFASDKYFDRLSYVAGLFAYYDQAEQTGYAFGGAYTFDTIVFTHAYAGYGEATLDLTKRLTAIAGVRYSWERRTADGESDGADIIEFARRLYHSTTPRGSLRYAITDSTNAYFSYSEGFKSGVTPSSIGAAPPTAPEKLKSYEVGVKTAGDDYAVNLAVFHYNYSDLQVEYYNGTIGFVANAASAQINGVDLDGTWRPTRELELRVGASILPKADYVSYPAATVYSYPLTPYGLTTYPTFNASGLRMQRTPKETVSLGGTYSIPFADGTLVSSASAYYSSNYKLEVAGRDNTDAYTLINGEVGYTPNGTKVKFSVFGKNLANKAYIRGGLLSGTADVAFYGPPREVGLRLDYSL